MSTDNKTPEIDVNKVAPDIGARELPNKLNLNRLRDKPPLGERLTQIFSKKYAGKIQQIIRNKRHPYYSDVKRKLKDVGLWEFYMGETK